MLALTQTRGEEESTDWHHPIEIVEPLRATRSSARRGPFESARAMDVRRAPLRRRGSSSNITVRRGSDRGPSTLSRTHWQTEHAPEVLARHVAYAASLRLARFATSNEVTDWFGPQHTLNFANAAHQLIVRSSGQRMEKLGPDSVRSLFHAAVAVYMDRYLNVPPAKPPSDRTLAELPEGQEELRQALLALLDQRAEIDAAAALVIRYVRAGHAIEPLLDTLTFAAVREDIDFHCLQVIEASARQCAAWDATENAETARDAIERILVGAVRNLAAHCPTRRAGQQTANIALRLHRGDEVFE